MTVKTRDFGEQNVSEDMILKFPNGLFAFEEQHRFIMLSPLGENIFPAWLQSVDDENLCFIVFDPEQIAKDYSITADPESLEAVGSESYDDLSYLVLAVVPEEYKNTTVNLKSPIIVNSEKMLAAQTIAAESYPIKFPIFKEGK